MKYILTITTAFFLLLLTTPPVFAEGEGIESTKTLILNSSINQKVIVKEGQKVLILVGWNPSEGDVKVTLIDPNGKIYDGSLGNLPENIEYTYEPGAIIYTIIKNVPGKWEAKLIPGSQNTKDLEIEYQIWT